MRGAARLEGQVPTNWANSLTVCITSFGGRRSHPQGGTRFQNATLHTEPQPTILQHALVPMRPVLGKRRPTSNRNRFDKSWPASGQHRRQTSPLGNMFFRTYGGWSKPLWGRVKAAVQGQRPLRGNVLCFRLHGTGTKAAGQGQRPLRGRSHRSGTRPLAQAGL